jgi:adenylate cyclase
VSSSPAPDVAPQDAATRLAVLPFESLSEDAAEAYFARGFVEDLIIELSRFPTLEVLHLDAFAGTDARDTLALHGATLYLRGTVRRGADVLRVTAQLIEVGSARPRWAERFDSPADRVLSVQDEIVARVARTLAI